jgi:hypothetical protein
LRSIRPSHAAQRGHVREEKGALRYRAILLGLLLRQDNDGE